MLENIKGCRKKALCLFMCVIIVFIVLATRIAFIQNNISENTAEIQSSETLLLSTSRGYIYDRNHIPFVNEKSGEKTVFLNNSEYSPDSLQEKVPSQERKGICFFSEKISEEENKYIRNYYTLKRYPEDCLCEHIIGYTDSSGKGVSGIEKAFDRILSDASGGLFVRYNSDASGCALPGMGLEIINKNYDSPAGVVLTVDKKIQRIAEEALENSEISCGACLVMDSDSFEILAAASVPAYDVNNISESLEDENYPFFNRAMAEYPVGSVFKPFVAISALENGTELRDDYLCEGECEVDGNAFSCYNNTCHGKEDLNKAIEKSCNTYFIDTALNTGAEKLCETMSLFGFGKEIKFCTTISSDSGYFPSEREITSDADIANLSFGQGSLLATPVQIAAAYSVLANGGQYKEPVLLKELINASGEVYAYYKSEISYNVASEQNCEKINICLYNNMLNGTGRTGAPDGVTSAGKTATAQTGRYDENGDEQLCTWFAGFFPFEEPRYTVVVLNENGSTASVDCAPVFKEIAENIVSAQLN